MMLARTGLVARQRVVPPLLRQRYASNDHHSHSHLEDDPSVYTKEGFTSPTWRRFFLLSLLAGAAYKFAPEPSEEAFITQWLSMSSTTSDKWLELNVGHTALSKDSAETVQLFATASRPAMHRMRFPQMMDNASPFNVSVGLNADTSDVVAKTERE